MGTAGNGRAGNGYRFDHAFIAICRPSPAGCDYLHTRRCEGLSDYAALRMAAVLGRSLRGT